MSAGDDKAKRKIQMSSVEETKAILATLEHKLAGAHLRKGECEAMIAGVSFGAHTGNEADRKKLAKVAADSAQWSAETKQLGAACAEAKRRVDCRARPYPEEERQPPAFVERQWLGRCRGSPADVDRIEVAHCERMRRAPAGLQGLGAGRSD